MAHTSSRWNGNWHGSTWASTRAIWKPLSPEEEEADRRSWETACDDQGNAFSVLICEMRQMLTDIFGHHGPKPPPLESSGPSKE